MECCEISYKGREGEEKGNILYFDLISNNDNDNHNQRGNVSQVGQLKTGGAAIRSPAATVATVAQ